MIDSAEKALLQLRNKISALVQMSDGDWALLLPHLSIKKIKKHGFIAKEGKKSYELGFVISGMFRQYYTKDG